MSTPWIEAWKAQQEGRSAGPPGPETAAARSGMEQSMRFPLHPDCPDLRRLAPNRTEAVLRAEAAAVEAEERRRTKRRRMLIGGGVAVGLVAVVAIAYAAASGDDDDAVDTGRMVA